MSTAYSTEQEAFWAGEFGDAYVGRNREPASVACRTALFAKVLARARGVRSILELGANIGLNLVALGHLLPGCRATGVEINPVALDQLARLPDVRAVRGSILDIAPADLGQYDLTFTSGVLIHIAPDRLPDVYERLYACSRAYVCVVEYYNPTPVEVAYRGHAGRLYKRDFAGELLDRYPDLELADYGFQYHRDAQFPLGDMTWSLLRRRG
jgi:pseudaminic acid biosynthesis-associated methylase